MRRYDLLWATNSKWWHFDENYNRIPNDDAPPEAKESYKRYIDQLKNEKRKLPFKNNTSG